MAKKKPQVDWRTDKPVTYDVYVVTVNPGGSTIPSQWYVTKAKFTHFGWTYMSQQALYGPEDIAAWAVIELPKPYEGEMLPAANT